MPLEIKKRPKETSQALVRRFNRVLKRSGILLRAKKFRFWEKDKSRQMKKRDALRREEAKKRYKRLEKLGKI